MSAQRPDHIVARGVTYVRVYPVAKGRCGCCGRTRNTTWTIPAVVAAARAWADKYGAPPTLASWRTTSPEHPNNSVVRRLFGTWNRMIRAADLKPRRTGGGAQRWYRDTVLAALLDYAGEHGHLPTTTEWRSAAPRGERPAMSTVIRIFGSWSAAISEARGTHLREHATLHVEPLAEAVRSYLNGSSSTDLLAELAGVDDANIRRLILGRKTFISRNAAEALALAIDRPDVLWLMERKASKDSAAPSLHPPGVDVEVVTANGSQGRPSTTTALAA